MKKIIILALTLIFLVVIAACSANNTTVDNQTLQNEAVEAPIVEDTEHMEEHVVESTDESAPAVEPKVEVEPTVESDEVKPEAEPKPEVVEEVIEPAKEEPKEEPAAAEPAPVVATPKIHKVDIVNFAFSLASLEISAGDIVEFTNLDGVKHSAVEDNGVFDTGLLAKGESKQVTFSELGEFGYYCGPHPDMRAKIIVQ